MKINVDNITIEFQTIEVEIRNKNQNNIFKDNTKRSLGYRLEKAIAKKEDRLNKKAKELKDKYKL